MSAEVMRSVQMNAYGDAGVLTMADVTVPTPGPKDLRIAVHATSINPVDTKVRAGYQRSVIRLSMPWALGMDVSGVVLEVGSAVTGFKVGDEVFASPSHRRMGCYAEQVVVRAEECAIKPASITHNEAAGIPLVGLTAWNSLVDACDVKPGDRVLIQAGSGGVGTFAVQLAKHLGAEVYATCSGRNIELVRDLGADHVINYQEEEFDAVATELDAVLDCFGGEHLDRAAGALRRGGIVAAISPNLPKFTRKYGPWLGLLALGCTLIRQIAGAKIRHGVSVRVVTRKPNGATLAKIAALIDEGVIRPVVDRVLPLDEASNAHAYVETGRARGKVILQVR